MLPHHKSLNDNVWPPPQPAPASPIAGGCEQDSCDTREPCSLSGEASHSQLQQLPSAATAVPNQGRSSPVFPSSSESCPEVKGAVCRSVNILDKKFCDEEKSFGGVASQIPDSEPGSTESTVRGAHGSVCRGPGCVGCNHHDGSDAYGSSHGGSTTVNSSVSIASLPKYETHLVENEKLGPIVSDSSQNLLLRSCDISASPLCSSDYCELPPVNISSNNVSIPSKIDLPCIPPSSSVPLGIGGIPPACIKDFPSLPINDTELLSNNSVDSIPGSSNARSPVVEKLSKLLAINPVSEIKVSESSKVSLVNGRDFSTASTSSLNTNSEIRVACNSSAQPSSVSEQNVIFNRPATTEQGTSTDMPEEISNLGSSASASNRHAPNEGAAPQQAQQPEADAGAHNAAAFPNVRIAVPTNLNQLRERMFRSLFLRASVAYARSTTPFIRRLLEFILLIKSLGCLFLLMLVHLYLCNQSPACLPADTEWDKTGILRVEVIPNPGPSYSLARSYQKEELLHRRYTMEGGTIIFTAMEEFNKVSDAVLLDETIMPSWNVDTPSKPYAAASETTEDGGDASEADESSELSWAEHVSASVREMTSPFFSPFAMGFLRLLYDGAQLPQGENKGTSNGSSEGAAHSCSVAEAPNPLLPPTTCPALPDFLPLQEEDDAFFYMPEDAFIMEYALDYGLLRLSGATRKRLGVPVTLVVLDPNTNPCFGDGFSTFLLSNLVGYDELLLAAVKTLAENDGGKGYLRNVVTGEHYRFVSTWLGGTNYVGAGLVMVVFTLSVSLLLRYSHHQIFLFIVHLLHMMEINATAMASFPAAPMLTVILALVGMEAIMSEFFKDTTTAFYIIVMVWVCDQYETLCCTQPITRKHWLRFFYLYHFAFYAYHYRFNGQYSWLALMTSWFFLQHSMLYFYHHYELPAMLRSRPRLQAVNIVVRRPPGEPTAGAGTSGTIAGTSGSSAGSSGTSAGTSGSSAGSSVTSAGTSGTSAGTSGSNAGSSGTSAGTSGISAGTSGSNAGSSGTSAGTSGSNAGSSGTSAGTSGTIAGTSESTAGSSGTSAGTSGSNAGSSGTSAGSSGTSAGNSGTSAGSSGSNAGSSESNAGTSVPGSCTSTPSRIGSSGSGSNTSTPKNGVSASGSSIATPGSSGCNIGVPESNFTTFTALRSVVPDASKFCTMSPSTPGSSGTTQGMSESISEILRASGHKITPISADPGSVENEAVQLGTSSMTHNSSKAGDQSVTMVSSESPSRNFESFSVPTPAPNNISMCKSENVNSGATCITPSSGAIFRKHDTISATPPATNSVTRDVVGRDTSKSGSKSSSSSSLEIATTASASEVIPMAFVEKLYASEYDGAVQPNSTGSCSVFDSDARAPLLGNDAGLSGERVSPPNCVAPTVSIASSDATSTGSVTKSHAMFIPGTDSISARVNPATTGIHTGICEVHEEVGGNFSYFSALHDSAPPVSNGSTAHYSRR